MELSLYKVSTITFKIVPGTPTRAGWIEFSVNGPGETLQFTCFAPSMGETPTLMMEEE